MKQEGRFGLLGLWSVAKTIAICAGIAYILGARITDALAIVAIFNIWADRIMREERKAAEKQANRRAK